jgi:hypothetical protein
VSQEHAPLQSVWVGPRLSTMQQLCIESYLQNGHPFHLYVYEDVVGVPAGTRVLDANEILPASRIFQYYEHASYAGFANFFRYKLLLESGGWYTDTDVVCLRPFDVDSEYVFASQGIHTPRMVNCNVMKVPPGSEIMGRAWDACRAMDTSTLRWGVSGPELTNRLVGECSLDRFVQPPEVFNPIDFPDWDSCIDGAAHLDFGPVTRGVHLWNEMWRRSARDKDAVYPADCLYERLKRRYGVEPFNGPRPEAAPRP